MKFLADIEVEEGLKDSDGDLGTGGQVLSSTGTGTNWIDATGTIGGSITDNQIAVGGATANTIEGSSDFTYTGSVFTVEGRMVFSDDLTTSAPNIYIGKDAGINSDLTGNIPAANNVGIGRRALEQLTDAGSNIAIGAGALRSATENSSNVAIGVNALFHIDGTFGTNGFNTVIGHSSGERYGASFTDLDFVTTGEENVFVGWRARPLANDPQNQIIIGYDALGGGDNTITLGDSNITTFRIPGLGNTNGHVLTYNTAAGGFILAAGGGGGGIGGATVTNQVAFGSATASEITSNSTFTFIKNGSTGSAASTILEVGDGDSSDNTSTGSVFINAKQVNDSTSRARFQLYSENDIRGYFGCSGTSTDVTLGSNANLVLSGEEKVTIDGGSTSDIVMASSSGSGVGIGTSGALTQKLTVNGTIYSEQDTGEVMIAGNSDFETKFITIRQGNNPAVEWGLQKGTTTPDPDTGIQPSGSVMLMRSSKDMAFRSNVAKNTTSFQNIDASHLSIVSPSQQSGSVANVGIGTDTPQSKLQVNGGVQIADDADSAAASKVGTFKYYTGTIGAFDYSYVDMCMQTDATTYEWVNIITNRWEN